ncbi:MAG: glutamate racemase [Christensenella hongkongensis]|uniref:glutamate racemase n=1 Tax=Christensenella hongkongensis TaxID=270498 RepID=UPI002A75F62B|nr:glutamate racemase [Christensenella hongkongensis]MDY3003333.1 glutamate racemase [Christensenella hongkongensis]
MMQDKELPLGVFDSGAGGISVLTEIRKLLPNEHYIYYGDSANAPYGTKTEEEIKELSLACGDFLMEQGIKMIVIACNTATSITVQTMRERYQIPVISIEPAVKPAVEKYPDNRTAVLATPATLHQKRYRHLLEKLGAQDQVVNIECEGLAELIEEGNLCDPHIKAYLCEKLLPYRGTEFSGVVVGCTHYSFISDKIHDVANKICGGACEIFDGKYGTANHVRTVLEGAGLLNDCSQKGNIKFFSSGDARNVEVFERFAQIM